MSGWIDQAYATGKVTATTGGGLLNRYGFGGGSVTNSYWDRQATGLTVSAAGTMKTTGELTATQQEAVVSAIAQFVKVSA